MRVKHRNRIAELREACGMRPIDLARAVHAHESQISKLENFQLSLSQDWLYRISGGLKRDPWELLPEWAARTPAEHIEALWEKISADEKTRLIEKYFKTYRKTLVDENGKGGESDYSVTTMLAGTQITASESGSKLIEVELQGDNMRRITFFRPARPPEGPLK